MVGDREMDKTHSAGQVWSILRENRDKVVAALKEGRFLAIHMSTWGFLDKFAAFLDQVGFYLSFDTFADPRARRSIPPFFFLIAMTYKTLLGYGSFDALPKTLFASSALLRLMGFNAAQIKQGFNQKGIVRPFDPETMSEFFQSFTQTTYLRWYADVVRLWRHRALLSGTFLLDCIYITTDSDHY
jgi:hypothetical protein